MHPVLLSKESITCPGAQYAFGWKSFSKAKNELLQNCSDKRNIQRRTVQSMLSRAPYFKKPFQYIGLNTAGIPDLVMTYIPPREVMGLIKMYHNAAGGTLDVSLCTMMAICGGVAVRTYVEEKVSLSFGCDDSRTSARMRRENLAVGIPKRLFNVFVE